MSLHLFQECAVDPSIKYIEILIDKQGQRCAIHIRNRPRSVAQDISQLSHLSEMIQQRIKAIHDCLWVTSHSLSV